MAVHNPIRPHTGIRFLWAGELLELVFPYRPEERREKLVFLQSAGTAGWPGPESPLEGPDGGGLFQYGFQL